jgi:hypothetical protein
MSATLKVGNRVRVKAAVKLAKYPAGEKGTVSRGPKEGRRDRTRDMTAAAGPVVWANDTGRRRGLHP